MLVQSFPARAHHQPACFHRRSLFSLPPGSEANRPLIIHEAPICLRPPHILPLISVLGIGISFWGTEYPAEVIRDPRSLISIGGVNILRHAYDTELGRRRSSSMSGNTCKSGGLPQVH